MMSPSAASQSSSCLRTLRGSLAGRSVLVLGLARQGRELVRFLAAQGAQVKASDRQAIPMDFVHSLPTGSQVRFVFGPQHPDLLADCDLLCISGGVDPGLPLVQAAVRQGISVVNDTLLTFARTPCPIILITGSSGKTTTTTLTGAMLAQGAAANQQVHIGGNIGQPLLQQATHFRSRDLLLWEGSSFQLELLDPEIMRTDRQEIQLDTVALLNVTPNHLDRHPGMPAYLRAKLWALYAIRPGGTAVLNADDPVCQRLIPECRPTQQRPLAMPGAAQCTALLQEARTYLREAGIRVMPYSLHHDLPGGIHYDRQAVWLGPQCLASLQEFRLRGRHNVSNALAACALAHLHGRSRAAMETSLQHFAGVPHRLEEVACQHGVLWINDSIATAPERAVAGIDSVCGETGQLILLAGGKDKDLPWHQFARKVWQRVHTLIAFGVSGPRIAAAVMQAREATDAVEPLIHVVDSLDCAVATARLAARPGAIVLMSPGAASFDAFADYEARGEHFRQLVLRPKE